MFVAARVDEFFSLVDVDVAVTEEIPLRAFVSSRSELARP